MKLRFIDWIWHVRGSIALAPGQTTDDAFDRLYPLFGQTGTSHERANNTLIFRKKDQAAQDKMSVFDSGVLQIENGGAEPVLHYHLISRALLFCFLAPLLFLGLGQLTVAVAKFQKPSTEAANKSGKKSSDTTQKPAAKKKADMPMNPIDKALGAPAPDKPEKKDADKDDKKPTSTPGYVFAGLFAVLYVVGRILEPILIKSLFKEKMLSA